MEIVIAELLPKTLVTWLSRGFTTELDTQNKHIENEVLNLFLHN